MSADPPGRQRWPWISWRRGALLVLVQAAAAVGIPWNHRTSEQRFLEQFERALVMSAALSADGLSDWVRVRHVQARTLAALAGLPGAVGQADAVAVMVAEGKFFDGQVEVGTAAGRVRDTLRIAAAPEGGQMLAEFRAPMVRAGRVLGAVRLRAQLNEAAFSHFNIAAPDDRTQRTVLLDRAPDVPRLPLLAVSAAGGAPEIRAQVSLPAPVTPAVAAQASYRSVAQLARHPHGIGTGIAGTRVVYASAPIPGTRWLLVRERAVDELVALVRPSLLVTDVIFGTLALLTLGLLAYRWRAGYLREQAAATQLRATFVASVSHELRTPLTQVRMYAEMLRRGLLTAPDERARALGVIEKEAERLTLLIERALAFVRSGQPAPPSPRDTVNVAEAVSRAREAIAALADERHVRMRVDIDAALTVQMARDDLQQVLLNLLDNAIKYGPVGQAVDISAARVNDQVRLVVRDHGAGITPAEREHIWQPFQRGHAAQVAAAAGSGIGLVVVRDLVTRAGGRARVETPADGFGAAFVVELPTAGD